MFLLMLAYSLNLNTWRNKYIKKILSKFENHNIQKFTITNAPDDECFSIISKYREINNPYIKDEDRDKSAAKVNKI